MLHDTPIGRRAEADQLLKLLEAVDPVKISGKDDNFIGRMREGNPVNPEHLAWLRAIKEKYL